MLKYLTLLSLAATVSLASAQSVDPAPPPQQPAPIVRTSHTNRVAPLRPRQPQNELAESQPIAGVWLRSESGSTVKTISATPQRTEISLDHGRLNVTVHQPAQHSEILVNLPGGQTSLLKDGLYTFNADTNTVRVLRGEAAGWPGPIVANATTKPIKIKEDHQLSLVAATTGKPGEFKSVEAYPYELTADLLPIGGGDRAYAASGYGDGYYPDYPYPSYRGVWGSPYGYGFYPSYYGYGYPFAYGVGIGYYGGFRGGYGHRGAFRR